MTLERDDSTGRYSANMKHRVFGRLHLRLKTKEKAVAMRRYTALSLLLDTGEPVRDLVDLLRGQKLTIQSVEECVRAKLPFASLRLSPWPTLAVAVEEYLAAIARRDEGSEATVKAAAFGLGHALLFFGGERLVASITHEEAEAYKQYLKGKGLRTNTLSAYLNRFSALYTFLVKREARRAAQQNRAVSFLMSPLDPDLIPTPTQTRARFLSEEEAELAFAACPPARQIVLALGVYAGLRCGEILMLRRGIDVDLGAGVLRLQAREGERPWHPKYRKDRDVPISSALRPYLTAALSYRTGAVYLLPGRDETQPVSYDTVAADMRRVVESAGLVWGRDKVDGVTLHTLRHTFASWLVMAGADLFTISKLMGHAGIKEVEETYAHLSPKHTRATVELLAARLDTTRDTRERAESA